MSVEDKTTDKSVPQEVRDYIKRVCEDLNQEEWNQEEKPFMIITSFEVERYED